MTQRSLFIAESDVFQQQLIDMLLAVDRYSLHMFETGRAVLEALKTQTPDLIMLADGLPDISGPDLCARIKGVRRLRHVPVILTSSPLNERAIQNMLPAVGASLALVKPLGDKRLRERVRNLIENAPTPEIKPEAPTDRPADVFGGAAEQPSEVPDEVFGSDFTEPPLLPETEPTIRLETDGFEADSFEIDNLEQPVEATSTERLPESGTIQGAGVPDLMFEKGLPERVSLDALTSPDSDEGSGDTEDTSETSPKSSPNLEVDMEALFEPKEIKSRKLSDLFEERADAEVIKTPGNLPLRKLKAPKPEPEDTPVTNVSALQSSEVSALQDSEADISRLLSVDEAPETHKTPERVLQEQELELLRSQIELLLEENDQLKSAIKELEQDTPVGSSESYLDAVEELEALRRLTEHQSRQLTKLYGENRHLRETTETLVRREPKKSIWDRLKL